MKSRCLALAVATLFQAATCEGETLFFGGDPVLPQYDFSIGSPTGTFMEVYEDFQIDAPTVVSSVFVEGYHGFDLQPQSGRFEIRSNLSEGNGGVLVASGSQLALAHEYRSTQSINGPLFRYSIQNLSVSLAPGRYWLMMYLSAHVAPSETTGVNGLGGPLDNGHAFVTSVPYLNSYFRELTGFPPNGAPDYAYGVVGSAVPEPASLAVLALGGLALRRRRLSTV